MEELLVLVRESNGLLKVKLVCLGETSNLEGEISPLKGSEKNTGSTDFFMDSKCNSYILHCDTSLTF